MNGMKLSSKHSNPSKQEPSYEPEFYDYEVHEESEEESSEPYQETPKKTIKSIKKDNEKSQIKSINKNISHLSVSINDLKDQYNDLDVEQAMFKRKNQKKQIEIQKFLDKKQKEKEQRARKIQVMRQLQERKRSQVVAINEQKEKKKVKKRVVQEQKKIAEFKEKRDEERKAEGMKNQLISQMYEQIHAEEEKKKKFHLRKEEEDREKKKQKEQMEKQLIKERKQFYKRPMNFQEFPIHQKKHYEKLEQDQIRNKAKRQRQYLNIIKKNQEFGWIHRGPSHNIIYEEMEQKRLKEEMPRKRVRNIKNYEEYVRQYFSPKIQPKIQQNAITLKRRENRSSSSVHKKVRRQKFYKGVSYGQIQENINVSMSKQERKKVGNEHLMYLKSLPRKQFSEEEEEQNKIEMLDQKFNQMLRVRKSRHPFVQNLKRDKEEKISEKPTRDQVNMMLLRLKNKDEKRSRKEHLVKNEANSKEQLSHRNQQINNDIIDTMERKLNLLSKLSNFQQ